MIVYQFKQSLLPLWQKIKIVNDINERLDAHSKV